MGRRRTASFSPVTSSTTRARKTNKIGVKGEQSQSLRQRSLVRRRDKARQALHLLLSRADDESFLRMVWAADALASGDRAAAARWFKRGSAANLKAVTSKPFFHKWTLETLVNELFAVPKETIRPGRRYQSLDCQNLDAAVQALHLLNELENAEDGIALLRVDVVSEIHRIGQRQFPWQRGNVNKTALYQSAYIYHFPEANAHFLQKHGVSISAFCRACFGVYSLLREYSGIHSSIDLESIEISRDETDSILRVISDDLTALRSAATAIGNSEQHTAYRQSVLRPHPLARSATATTLICPIPDLLVERFTTGLYYDLVDAGGAVRDIIGRRFETYCHELLNGYLEEIKVEPEHTYASGQASPDLLLLHEGQLKVVVECKAKKAPLTAKFSEEPDALKAPGLEELAKGVFQIWRYFADIRTGRTSQVAISTDAVGVVLMLDTWMEASSSQRSAVRERANAMAAAKKTPYITNEDRRPVVFCHVDDLGYILRFANDEQFLGTLALAATPDRDGWHLAGLLNELYPDANVVKSGPFETQMSKVVNWLPGGFDDH